MQQVLVIDDDIPLGKLLQEHLTNEGFGVEIATLGEDGFSAAIHGHPDLILLDVNLPDATGFQICSRLRQHAVTRTTPIIMMTGTARFPNQQAIGRQMGANDYILKPFEVGVVSDKIQALLNPGAPVGPSRSDAAAALKSAPAPEPKVAAESPLPSPPAEIPLIDELPPVPLPVAGNEPPVPRPEISEPFIIREGGPVSMPRNGASKRAPMPQPDTLPFQGMPTLSALAPSVEAPSPAAPAASNEPGWFVPEDVHPVQSDEESKSEKPAWKELKFPGLFETPKMKTADPEPASKPSWLSMAQAAVSPEIQKVADAPEPIPEKEIEPPKPVWHEIPFGSSGADSPTAEAPAKTPVAAPEDSVPRIVFAEPESVDSFFLPDPNGPPADVAPPEMTVPEPVQVAVEAPVRPVAAPLPEPVIVASAATVEAPAAHPAAEPEAPVFDHSPIPVNDPNAMPLSESSEFAESSGSRVGNLLSGWATPSTGRAWILLGVHGLLVVTAAWVVKAPHDWTLRLLTTTFGGWGLLLGLVVGLSALLKISLDVSDAVGVVGLAAIPIVCRAAAGVYSAFQAPRAFIHFTGETAVLSPAVFLSRPLDVFQILALIVMGWALSRRPGSSPKKALAAVVLIGAAWALFGRGYFRPF